MLRRCGCWVVLMVGCLLICGCDHSKATAQGGNPSASHSPKKPAKGPQPRFTAQETTHNFGQLDQEKSGTHVFVIQNDGEGELQFWFKEMSCGCTSAKVGDLCWDKKQNVEPPKDPVTLPPGGQIELQVNWNTEHKSGQFKTVVSVETNDFKQPKGEFFIEGEIVPSVELSQYTLNIEDARNTKVSTAHLLIFSKKLDDLQVTDYKASHEQITAEFEPAKESALTGMEAKSGLRATIKLEPGLPIGPFTGSITFHTNSEDRPEVSVSVGSQIRGDVIITPEEKIAFGIVPSNVPNAKGVFLKVRSESTVKVEVSKVKLERADITTDKEGTPVDSGFLKVTLTKVESEDEGSSYQNFYRLKVELPQGSPGGQYRGTIELKTDHPTASVVNIPVSFQLVQ